MTETISRARREMQALVPAAAAACLVTAVVGLAGAIAIASARGSSATGELLVIYVPIMIIPFALSIAVVQVPILALVRAVSRAGRRWVFVCTGLALAPVQVLFLLGSGRLFFHGTPKMRPTLAADLAAIWAHPNDTLALLVAFAAGGLVLGLWTRRQ
jgi:hypothetical protein